MTERPLIAIDFRKAKRLMEEAKDRLEEASEIPGVFDTGDVSGENTIAKHMGAEI